MNKQLKKIKYTTKSVIQFEECHSYLFSCLSLHSKYLKRNIITTGKFLECYLYVCLQIFANISRILRNIAFTSSDFRIAFSVSLHVGLGFIHTVRFFLIATVIPIIATNGLHRTQWKCSHHATVTTSIVPIQLIVSKNKLQSQIARCERALTAVKGDDNLCNSYSFVNKHVVLKLLKCQFPPTANN